MASGSIAYNTGSNTITIISGSTNSFNDIYNADVAGGWGVVTIQGTSQYYSTAKIVIGDGTTATTFLDSNKQIVFYGAGSAGGSNWIDVKAAATVTFGVLVDATSCATTSGIAFLFQFTSNFAYLNADTNAVCDLYSCSFSGVGGCISRMKGNGIRRIWNFIGNTFYLGQISSATSDFYNIYFTAYTGGYGLYASPLTATMNKITVRGAPAYIAWLSTSTVISNLDGAGATTKTFDVGGVSAYTHYLINPVITTWTFNWAAGSDTKVYRQYLFDLKVTDKDGTAIDTAAVTLKDKDGNVVFNVNTAADGTIAQQTVSRGWYQKTTGDTLNEYSPHNLTIVKANYQTYDQDFTLDEVTDWEIALSSQLSGDADETDVISGKTFYKDDAATQLTGSYVIPPVKVAGSAKGWFKPVPVKIKIQRAMPIRGNLVQPIDQIIKVNGSLVEKTEKNLNVNGTLTNKIEESLILNGKINNWKEIIKEVLEE